jgi:hypothetical protein
MPTIATGSSPYCSVTQFLNRVDVRAVCELLSDDTIPVDPSTLSSNAILLDLLSGASGRVESAATVAEAYAIIPTAIPPRNDLALIANGGGNGAALLADIVAGLAWWRLLSRRPNDLEAPPLYKDALEYLDQLRNGERIFGILENATAGELSDYVESSWDVESRLLPTYEAEPLFSRRNNRWTGCGRRNWPCP